ncbi:hypothetical protein BHM03_00033010 [Ensete ventricosum]|nr:hypothetical protein BHM03_00033010 [Ensete ventricosum]
MPGINYSDLIGLNQRQCRPTFYRVYKRKSTEGFQSVPYVVALFSAMLWISYALLKTDACLLITINSVGCAIETVYIVVYLAYAPKAAKVRKAVFVSMLQIFTAKLVLLVIVAMFGLILLLTLLLSKGAKRVEILGWICVSFSVSVFVAPLSVIVSSTCANAMPRVEFMPFSLSFFLTLSAVVWFAYGLLIRDLFVALPNVLGFIFGILQMALYVAYKDRKKVSVVEQELPKHVLPITKPGTAHKAVEVHRTVDEDKVGDGDQKEIDDNNEVMASVEVKHVEV